MSVNTEYRMVIQMQTLSDRTHTALEVNRMDGNELSGERFGNHRLLELTAL